MKTLPLFQAASRAAGSSIGLFSRSGAAVRAVSHSILDGVKPSNALSKFSGSAAEGVFPLASAASRVAPMSTAVFSRVTVPSSAETALLHAVGPVKARYFSKSELEDLDSYNIYGKVSEIPYTPDGPTYKVSARGGDPEERNFFPNERFIAPVSIGQAPHENGRLKGTLQFLKDRFAGGVILVDDAIKFWTMGIAHPDRDDDELRAMCLAEGDEWLDRYGDLIENTFGGEVRIARWQETVNYKAFEANKAKVEALLLADPEYSLAFERNIYEFAGRVMARNADLNFELACDRTKSYLIEECASMMGWRGLYGVDREIYPTNRNHAMSITNELLMENKLPHVGLRYSKKGVKARNEVQSQHQNSKSKRHGRAVEGLLGKEGPQSEQSLVDLRQPEQDAASWSTVPVGV